MLESGDPYSGKQTLVARLQRRDLEDVPKGLALDFTTLEFPSDNEGEGQFVFRSQIIADREYHAPDPTCVDVWTLSGDAPPRLLDAILTPARSRRTALLVVLDASRPWAMLAVLRRWVAAVAARIDARAGGPAALAEMRASGLFAHLAGAKLWFRQLLRTFLRPLTMMPSKHLANHTVPFGTESARVPSVAQFGSPTTGAEWHEDETR